MNLILFYYHLYIYRKVASSRLSRLVARSVIFRLFMKGNFDAYVQNGQNGQKLNNRPVYCSRLYGICYLIVLICVQLHTYVIQGPKYRQYQDNTLCRIKLVFIHLHCGPLLFRFVQLNTQGQMDRIAPK